MRFSLQKNLGDLRADALQFVDDQSADKRRESVTVSAGQSAIYASKLADAKDFIARGAPPSTAQNPWIGAEAQARGITPLDAANLIIASAASQTILSVQLELIRQSAKVAVRAATTSKQVYDAKRWFVHAMSKV